MPLAPPTTMASPKLPLCCACSRGADKVRAASHPASSMALALAATPRSSNHTHPAWSRPCAVNRPGLSVSSASVCVARTATAGTAPLSLCRPDGTSTASTGRPLSLSRFAAAASAPSSARLTPRPSSASTVRSACTRAGISGNTGTPASCACCQAWRASSGLRAGSPTITSRASLPQPRSSAAATKPSPPLLPGPHHNSKVRA